MTDSNNYMTRESLIQAYANHLELNGADPVIAKIMAKDKAVYVPHVYRGGWVIRGFGYSTERVGKFVTTENAGYPQGV